MASTQTLQFSQRSLQDYLDCPRRYQLRFELAQPWPTPFADLPPEAEQHMQRGADLHHLIHQHAVGIDAAHLAATITDPVLARWWKTYVSDPLPDLAGKIRRSEATLSAPVAGHPLVARLDLLAATPGERATVVDWKTPLRRPPRRALAARLQTRVYPYLVVEAGASLIGGPQFRPEQVEMIYWFAEFGGASERFAYNAERYEADRGFLETLVREICGRSEPVWPLTSDERLCHLCDFRSFCRRGAGGISVEDLDEDLEPTESDNDLDRISDIAYG